MKSKFSNPTKVALIVIALMNSPALLSGEGVNYLENENVVIVKQDDLICKLEYIHDSAAAILGMRLEIFNNSEKENFVLVVREYSDLFKLKIKDSKSDLVIEPHNVAGRKATADLYRYDCIIAQTSHAWFISLPYRIKAKGDPSTDVEIPLGAYKIKLSIVTNYFKTKNAYIGGYDSKTLLTYPDNPDYKDFVITFPEKLIELDPEKIKNYTSKSKMFEAGTKKK